MALRWPNSQMKSQTFLNCYDVQCTTYFSNKTFCDVSRSTLPAFMLRQSVLALLLLFINFCWCGLKLRWFHALNMTLLHVHAWISLESTFLRSTPDFSAHSFLKTYLFRAKWGTEGTSPWEFYNCRHVRSACTVRGVSDLQSAGPSILVFNNYSPKAKLILLNNPRDEVEGIIQQY